MPLPVERTDKVPATVWALGFVSLFMDISSEMIHALLPLFLMTTLGASAALVGVIEGIGEATASIVKLFSGWVSDRIGNRKWLMASGYALAAATKPIFAFAATPYQVLFARFADRVGKGVRVAPRDALVADVTPEAVRGEAYGLRQALDTVGATVGPLTAIILMLGFEGDMRTVFRWAIIPAMASVLVAVFAVKEPPLMKTSTVREPIRLAVVRDAGAAFWTVVAVAAVFTMARFSEAFLILRAQNMGLAPSYAPIVMVVMSSTFALTSTPAGAWSDRDGRRRVLAFSLGPLLLADVILALWSSVVGVVVGVALWGIHLGMSQGLFAALVADTVAEHQRGTAFGVFNFITGIVQLFASVLAGVLWQVFGPAATFLTGGGFALFSLAGLLMVLREPRTEPMPN